MRNQTIRMGLLHTFSVNESSFLNVKACQNNDNTKNFQNTSIDLKPTIRKRSKWIFQVFSVAHHYFHWFLHKRLHFIPVLSNLAKRNYKLYIIIGEKCYFLVESGGTVSFIWSKSLEQSHWAWIHNMATKFGTILIFYFIRAWVDIISVVAVCQFIVDQKPTRTVYFSPDEEWEIVVCKIEHGLHFIRNIQHKKVYKGR